MNVKLSIYVTESDNELYFDSKLSKKELSENSILRIVRDIKHIGEEKTGVVTRRGKPPLEVIELENQWNINGIHHLDNDSSAEKTKCKKEQPKETTLRAVNTGVKKENKKKITKWDRLTQHERNLIICVKYDIHDDFDKNERLAKIGFNKNGAEISFSDIPRFKAGEIYVLNDEKYRITDNNGKYLYFSNHGEQGRAVLETDLLGEFVRPIKNKMEIIHSIDYKKN